jgi:hypothetical protein
MNNTVVDLQLYLEYQTEVLVTAHITLGLVRFVAVTCPGTAMLRAVMSPLLVDSPRVAAEIVK